MAISRRTDNSLYLAKLTGRNKVVFDEEIAVMRQRRTIEYRMGTFRSGNIQVDLDHHELITISNEIIRNCLVEGKRKLYQGTFDKLISDTRETLQMRRIYLPGFDYEELETREPYETVP